MNSTGTRLLRVAVFSKITRKSLACGSGALHGLLFGELTSRRDCNMHRSRQFLTPVSLKLLKDKSIGRYHNTYKEFQNVLKKTESRKLPE
jgi:hypothetical protein